MSLAHILIIAPVNRLRILQFIEVKQLAQVYTVSYWDTFWSWRGLIAKKWYFIDSLNAC